ncbi:GAP family protein [Mycetocola tolaasinivorans]|uniref:GAP family protein n=1 Tax=Mycetocola tolaasinivorans TaxID=76635 RepID=A0A3L7A9Z9_9MICO|nr:GAP family protein [Mycetocola tolaasinivorans]RLP77266.1 GAP family protein [Mycetocola tolaasinivorans]
MYEALGEGLPLMIGVALSPVPMIATILMLLSPRARATAPAFMLGWLFGLAVVLAGATALSSVLPEAEQAGPKPVIGIIKILLAGALFFLAYRKWKTRPAPGESAPLPRWMDSINDLGVGRSIVLGLVLSANPKNLVLAISAGLAVGTAGPLSLGEAILAIVILALLGSLTIVVPVAGYLVAADRLAGTLEQVRAWLTQNNAAMMATLLLVFAFVLLGKGIASFS